LYNAIYEIMMQPGRTDVGRIAALVSGVVILGAASLVSAGIALAAPIGMFVIDRVQRARGRRFGGWESWVGAVSGVTIAILLVGSVFATRLPPGTLNRIRQAADSASVAASKQPPPAWVTRLSPSAGRYSMAPTTHQSAFNVAALLWGSVIAAGILGGFLGTIGWAGSILLMFYANARWFGAAPTAADGHPSLNPPELPIS
jgi:hypothetical protein